MGFYKILFIKGFPRTFIGRVLLELFRLIKLINNFIKIDYTILPLDLKTKIYIPLDRRVEDFDEALVYAYYGQMYELVQYFRSRKNVVVDVGAHYGFYTLKMARKAKLVVSLEPNPRNYAILRHNLEINRVNNVIALCVAAGSRTHWAYMTPGYTDEMSFVVEKTGLIGNNTNLLSTLVVELDSLLMKLGISRVDLLKVDVEGYELEVLKGLSGYLRKGLIESIVMEVHSKQLLREVVNLITYKKL